MTHGKLSRERGRVLMRLIAVVGMLCAATSSSAITIGQVDDFQDGTTEHWSGAGPENVEDAGPSGMGDDVMLVTATGSSSFGGKLVAYNAGFQWDGKWTAAGVAQVAMDIRNASEFPLMMRLGIGGPGGFSRGVGDVHVSTIAISIPVDNAWHSVTFPVLAGDFTTIYPQNGDINSALADVKHFRILHNPQIDFLGAAVAGGFYVDNIRPLAPTDELPGDYNENGSVDAADYVVWRKNDGSQNGYETWINNFGRTSSGAAHVHGSALTIGSVPEPGTSLLLLTAIAFSLSLSAVGRRRECAN